MKYEYTGRHLDVTPALKSHVETHFDKINHLFNGDNAKAQVIIEVEKGGRHRAEVILKWRDHVLTATTNQPDMYQSLTQTIDKIEKQAIKLKDKVIDKHQKKNFGQSKISVTQTLGVTRHPLETVTTVTSFRHSLTMIKPRLEKGFVLIVYSTDQKY